MAVELAKTALWLHTFTVGAPLSFLDHHLKLGDSLHGERLPAVRADLNALGMLFNQGELDRLALAARGLARVADLTDVDIAEAQLPGACRTTRRRRWHRSTPCSTSGARCAGWRQGGRWIRQAGSRGSAMPRCARR